MNSFVCTDGSKGFKIVRSVLKAISLCIIGQSISTDQRMTVLERQSDSKVDKLTKFLFNTSCVYW